MREEGSGMRAMRWAGEPESRHSRRMESAGNEVSMIKANGKLSDTTEFEGKKLSIDV